MPNNRTCRFKVSNEQYSKIKQESTEKGYVKIAPYLRELVLNKNQFLEFKIIETNQLVKKILEVLRDGRK
ncbi:MAG: hypothetical protein WCV90_06845 [Candidatus Woesearchaeota archaeon]|jgi:hypothetical protein